jgi:hypothetical protein
MGPGGHDRGMDTTPALPPPITDAQVRAFMDQGFLIIPGLVTGEEVAELRRETAFLARGGRPIAGLEPLPPGAGDEEALRRLLCIHQPHAVSPVIARFIAHPGIAAVLGRIVGAHLPAWDGSVKCMQSMLFVKPPGKPGQAWHQDEMYIPTRDRSLCGAWIALDDATVENGCLWLVPGSHRTGYLFPTRPPADLGEFDGSDECHGFDEAAAIPAEAAAGTVVFFNGYLLHRSLRNRSPGCHRRALVNHYMNAWSLLPWGPEGAQPSVAMGDNRAVVPVAGRDPYAWKGVRPAAAPHLRMHGRAWTGARG